ncbi:MAG: hypothetical protein ACK47B_23865 [Armatimonadota bacterium]
MPVVTPEEHMAAAIAECEATVERCRQDPRAEVRGAAKLAEAMLYHNRRRPFPGYDSIFSYLKVELECLEEKADPVW